MKKIVLSLISVLMVVSVSFGQDTKSVNDFVGIIEMEFSYPDSEGLDAMVKAQLPSKATAYYGNGKSKVIQNTPAMQTTIINIDDGDEFESYIYIDAMGQKMYINPDIDKEDIAETLKSVKVKEFKDEKKTIAGYECFKIVYSADGVNDITSYVTDKLQNNLVKVDKPFSYIELYQETEVNGIKIIYSATNVEAKKLKDKDFKLLKGYQEVPAEMLGM